MSIYLYFGVHAKVVSQFHVRQPRPRGWSFAGTRTMSILTHFACTRILFSHMANITSLVSASSVMCSSMPGANLLCLITGKFRKNWAKRYVLARIDRRRPGAIRWKPDGVPVGFLACAKAAWMIELNFPDAVREEKDFYGRRLELERVARTLTGGGRRPVVVLSDGMIGKASLQTVSIRQLTTRQPWTWATLILPPASTIHSFDDYARAFVQSLCSYLNADLGETGLMVDDDAFRLASIGQFTDVTSRLMDGLSGRTFIICIDEFDAIVVNCPGTDAERIIGLTAYLIQRSGLPLLFYLTMTRLPKSLKQSYRSPEIAKAEVIRLGTFTHEETSEMVTGLLHNHMALDPSGIERLFQLSGGHPYVIKLLLDRLVLRYGSRKLTVTSAMIEQSAADATNDARALHTFENIYHVDFTRQEQQLVMLLADRRCRLTRQQLKALGPYQNAAHSLERRGYLRRTDGDTCDFRIGLLGNGLRGWAGYEDEHGRLELDALW